MKREYLEEDLALIRKYFPGARPVALRTPFDITPKDRRRLQPDVFRAETDEEQPGDHWYGGLLWNR